MMNLIEQFQVWALSEIDREDDKPLYVHDKPNDLYLGQCHFSKDKFPNETVAFDCYYSSQPLEQYKMGFDQEEVCMKVRWGDQKENIATYPIWKKPPKRYNPKEGFSQAMLNFAQLGFDMNGWFDFRWNESKSSNDLTAKVALDARERLERLGLGGKRIAEIHRDREALEKEQATKKHGMTLKEHNFSYNPVLNSFRAEIPVYDGVSLSVIKGSSFQCDEETFEVGVVGLFRETEVYGYQSEEDIWNIYHKAKDGSLKRNYYSVKNEQ